MAPSLSEHYKNRQPSAIRKAQILFESRTDKHEVEVVNLAIGNKSFFINEDESWLYRQNNSDRNRSNRNGNGNNRMRNTNRRNNYQNDSFETYKFNFGKMDRVRVANIISSICTSTNINGSLGING